MSYSILFKIKIIQDKDKDNSDKVEEFIKKIEAWLISLTIFSPTLLSNTNTPFPMFLEILEYINLSIIYLFH